MKYLCRVITTSKIRDLMAQVNELYNDIILESAEILDEKYVEAIKHLRVKMIYDAGRDRQERLSRDEMNNPKLVNGKLSYFFNETGLLDMVTKIGNSRKAFLEYCRYFEALVAYHKFYGGK
jgi:CRISPR-associated protein Csm2